jgi:predicted nicotinamide N-methyase
MAAKANTTINNRNKKDKKTETETPSPQKYQQKEPTTTTTNASVSNTSEMFSTTVNQPRNWVVTDATKPYIFKYLQYGKPVCITIHQTPNEETWPGGALWDIGVLLANVLVCLGGFQCYTTATTAAGGAYASSSSTATKTNNKNKSSNHHQRHNVHPPSRLLDAFPSTKDLTVLELGCGVGLTGIVGSAVLGTQLTILTDIDIVTTQVTQPNVERNSTIPSSSSSSSSSSSKKPVYRISTMGKRGRVMSMPLCWGNVDDEDAVYECFRQWTKVPKTSRKNQKQDQEQRRKTRPSVSSSPSSSSSSSTTKVMTPYPISVSRDPGQPDLIIIGDVAYQHRPGAPSHFDVLLSTLLRFLGPHTIVIFGTRMRMPASSDLLDMFREHMDEIVQPPISADEIDPTFASFKHQITVHVFRKKQ